MKAYMIPGWGEDIKGRNYSAILDVYKRAGYDPEFVPITWKYKTIEDWVEEVKAKLTKHEIQNSLLSGFSFGAVTAISLAGTYQNPKKLNLFSLSSYYSGDNPKSSWLEYIGKRRVASFKATNFNELASNIKCPTDIYCGSKEGSEMLHRANQANKAITDSRLFIIDGVGHDAADPQYVRAIETAVKI
jgi:pimeloyl-ACP methyl ester carboxylesterase